MYKELDRPLQKKETQGDPETVTFHLSRKSRQNFIIGLLVIFLVIAILLVITFAILYGVSSSSDSSSTSDTCQSEACFDLSVQILASMDDSVDPCEDFYNFSCGNWDIYQHIRPGMAGYNTLTVQQYEVYDELADVLESDFAGGNQVLIELQDFYDSCITAYQSDTELDLPTIRDLYQRLGGWSLVNIPGDGTVWGLNSQQFIREKMLGSEAFYSLFVFPNDAYSENTLYIEPSGLTLGDYLELYNDTNSTEMLQKQIEFILTKLSPMPNATRISDAAYEIVQFERNLSQILDDDYDDIIIEPFTVDELRDLWPEHDWLTVLRGVLGPSGVDIQPSSRVNVVTPDYFRNLSSVISSASLETLENYAKWIPTWGLVEIFLSDDAIRASVLEFKEAVLGKPSMQEREQCVSVTETAMPVALGRVYADRILPSGSKEAGMELVTEVREGLRQRMMEVDWLDDETRKLSIEKLEAIESRVAYPEKTFDDSYLDMLYGDFRFDPKKYTENYITFINISHRQQFSRVYQPVDRTKFDSPPTTVNAYYFAIFNQITILEGIMKTPTFHKDWPLSIQYGALGMILGHELTHGFDNNGRQYDKDGRRRMWWTEEAVQAFKDRAQCFVKQYSNYEMYGISVNGSLTLGENIADNGGIKASYNAFQNVAQRSQRLPGLTDFTNEQLFFIAFGQLWCSYTTESSFRVSVLDEHSPDAFRVLGTLVNNEDFAEAFSCPAGSPMNPQNKCELW